MEQTLQDIINSITSIMGSFGLFSGFLIIILESMIPILPLAVFIALNIITYGVVIGFVVSWLGTIIGCMLMFYMCRKFKDKFLKKYKNNQKITKFRKKIDNISYSNLVLILSIPFTPAFAINIGAGLSEIEPKKYFSALIIGKIPMVYFWGFIGKSFLESITDIYTIAQIVFMLALAFLVSKIANKFLNV